MVDTEKLIKLAEDTVTHKKLVMDNCLLLAEHYMTCENPNISLAISILNRGASHDNSKFNNEEFMALSKILKSDKCFTDASTSLSEQERQAIQHHWEHNKHHPEYFESPDDMGDIDMVEMVCDWFARSIQYKTDFIPFILERQNNRFHFSDEKFEMILETCKLIERLYNEKHNLI